MGRFVVEVKWKLGEEVEGGGQIFKLILQTAAKTSFSERSFLVSLSRVPSTFLSFTVPCSPPS